MRGGHADQAPGAHPIETMNKTRIERIYVWDRFVRTFHWTLVGCIIFNYIIADDGKQAHQLSGYMASAMVAVRIIWGFLGSPHARFSDFFPTPSRIKEHVAKMIKGDPDFQPGHNPLGGLMMLTLIALVLGLGISGHLQTTDAFWGEEWLETLHEGLASTLIALACLHVAAALLMSRLQQTNLVGAMVTGFKTHRQDAG